MALEHQHGPIPTAPTWVAAQTQGIHVTFGDNLGHLVVFPLNSHFAALQTISAFSNSSSAAPHHPAVSLLPGKQSRALAFTLTATLILPSGAHLAMNATELSLGMLK